MKDFVEHLGHVSPNTMFLIDEAYHEYVDDPAYATAIPRSGRHSSGARLTQARTKVSTCRYSCMSQSTVLIIDDEPKIRAVLLLVATLTITSKRR